MKSPTCVPVSAPKLPAAGAVELEDDDGPVGQRIELRAGVDQAGAGDDRLVLQRVQQPIALHPDAERLVQPSGARRPRGQSVPHLGDVEQAVDPRDTRLPDTMYAPGIGVDGAAAGGLDQRRENARCRRRPRRWCPPALPESPQAAWCTALARRAPVAGAALDAEAAEDPVHRRESPSRARPVLSTMRNSRKALFCTMFLARAGSAMPGELDDDPVVAGLLDHRLGDAELVDALPEHGQREVDVALGVGRDAAGSGRARGRGACRPGGRGRA